MKHAWMNKEKDPDPRSSVPFVYVTRCGLRLAPDSQAALWIEDFGNKWQLGQRSDLCPDCGKDVEKMTR